MQAKLKWSEGEVEDEVKHEGQEYNLRQLALPHLIEDKAEGDGNKQVEYRPHWSEEESRWRPSRLNKCRIPVVCVHVLILSAK